MICGTQAESNSFVLCHSGTWIARYIVNDVPCASCSLCGLASVSKLRATQNERVGLNAWSFEGSCNRWELMHYANKCCPAPIMLDVAYDATTQLMWHGPGKGALSPGKVRPIYPKSIKASQHVKTTSWGERKRYLGRSGPGFGSLHSVSR